RPRTAPGSTSASRWCRGRRCTAAGPGGPRSESPGRWRFSALLRYSASPHTVNGRDRRARAREREGGEGRAALDRWRARRLGWRSFGVNRAFETFAGQRLSSMGAEMSRQRPRGFVVALVTAAVAAAAALSLPAAALAQISHDSPGVNYISS